MATPKNLLCLASYFKGNRFLESAKASGARVHLLTVERCLGEPWPREVIDAVSAVPSFLDRRSLVNAVAYLDRSIGFDHIVALDDFDVEVAAFLREHFRLTHFGHGETTARFFRDKLAMRQKARDLGIRIPDFCPLFHHARVAEFLARVPAPWLIKPRSEASAAGIHKLHRPEEVWRKLEELGDEQSYYLLEQMVPGDLFHVDSLTQNDRVIFAEVNGYLRPLLDVYHGGGVYATRTYPRDHPDVAALTRINAQVLEGFELGQGASHTEFMKAHADGQFYFIETSARVGGANTAEMVEHARGVNLWTEWAKLELARGGGAYQLPPLKERYGGVVISLARQEDPDTSGFSDPEIVYRLKLPYHIGFVLVADHPDRIQQLLRDYQARIARDFTAVLPAAEKAGY